MLLDDLLIVTHEAFNAQAQICQANDHELRMRDLCRYTYYTAQAGTCQMVRRFVVLLQASWPVIFVSATLRAYLLPFALSHVASLSTVHLLSLSTIFILVTDTPLP